MGAGTFQKPASVKSFRIVPGRYREDMQLNNDNLLLILKILHDLNIQYSYYSQFIMYLGSCRIFSIHRSYAF